MMNFDILDTRAGQDAVEIGRKLGTIDTTRKLVIGALEERFQIVPVDIIDKIKAIEREELLNSLFKRAMRCGDLAGFNEVLARAR